MWKRMTLDEFAAEEKDSGELLVHNNGIWFRKVRFAFHRSLYPFQELSPDMTPDKHWLKCYQYSVKPDMQANSFLNCIVFDRQQDYAIENLSKHQRRYLRTALKSSVELKIIERPETIYEQGFEVYQSFIGRANYNFRKDRCARKNFERWIYALMQHPKLIIHGAYHENKLVAMYISCQIEDTVFWKAAINSSEAITLRTPEIILHAYREGVRDRDDIRWIYCGMLSKLHNQNMFKIRRGARITALPAFHQGTFMMRTLCKLLPSSELKRLIGYTPAEVDLLLETYKQGKS